MFNNISGSYDKARIGEVLASDADIGLNSVVSFHKIRVNKLRDNIKLHNNEKDKIYMLNR